MSVEKTFWLFISALLVVVVIVFVVASRCGWLGIFSKLNSYQSAVQSGRSRISYVQEIERLSSQIDHSISYYTGQYGTPTWNSKAGFLGRYVVSFQLPITFDADRKSIVSYGEPKFLVIEIGSIQPGPGGTSTTRISREAQFGLEQWKAFVDSSGDLRTIGIDAVNEPIVGFDKAWPNVD